MGSTFSGQVSALATAVGTDVKQITANVGDLSALTTSQKASLVLALNELKASLGSLDLSDMLDDSQTVPNKTWSSKKIDSAISSAVSALVSGAPEAMDTLKELSTVIAENKSGIEALEKLAAGHVRFDKTQNLTSTQQGVVLTNIGGASAQSVADVKGIAEGANASATEAKNKIGNLATLKTTAKTTLVDAINEINEVASTARSTSISANSAATKAQEAVNVLTASVGDTSADFVGIYTTARNGS